MRLLFLVFVLCLTILPAWAGALLIFRDDIRGPREREVLNHLTQTKRYDPALPFKIAPFDLNGDGVEEWIFQEKTSPACESNADCRFTIAGISGGKIALLGEMRGGKIGVADEKQYGVRKLLVYNEKNNDFEYQTYVWTPASQAFAPE